MYQIQHEQRYHKCEDSYKALRAVVHALIGYIMQYDGPNWSLYQ